MPAIAPGSKVGRLTVLHVAVKSPLWQKTRWACQCECGAAHEASGKSLYYARTRSCGCLNREAARARMTQQHHDGRMRHTRACIDAQEAGAACSCRFRPGLTPAP